FSSPFSRNKSIDPVECPDLCFLYWNESRRVESLLLKNRRRQMPMKNRRRRVAPRLAKSDINITPLIDVLLVLLVIFIVITPVTPTGLDTAIPQPAPHGEPRTPEQVIVLSVDREGAIRINQERLELSALMPRLV